MIILYYKKVKDGNWEIKKQAIRPVFLEIS